MSNRELKELLQSNNPIFPKLRSMDQAQQLQPQEQQQQLNQQQPQQTD